MHSSRLAASRASARAMSTYTLRPAPLHEAEYLALGLVRSKIEKYTAVELYE